MQSPFSTKIKVITLYVPLLLRQYFSHPFERKQNRNLLIVFSYLYELTNCSYSDKTLYYFIVTDFDDDNYDVR